MKSRSEIITLEKTLGIEPGKCGSGFTEWVVPDRPFWMWYINIRWACREHDIAYTIGGNENDRWMADNMLRNNIISIYKKSWIWRFKTFRRRARLTADTYYDAVQKYGEDKFNHKEDV